MAKSLSRRPLIVGAAFLCAAFVLFVQSAFFLIAHAQTSTPPAPPLLGHIMNGTESAPTNSVAGLTVTLFQMGGSGPVTRTVQTNDKGVFAFPDATVSAQTPYFVQVDYQGIHYFSDILQGDISATAPLSLTVYETAPLSPNYQIDSAHFILEVAPHQVGGVELLQLSNPTDKAFLLPLPLMVNPSAIQFNDPRDEFRAVKSADGSLAFPVLPTTTEILVGVTVDTQAPNAAFKIKTPVKIGQLNVLVAQTGDVQVSSPDLTTGAAFTPPPNPNSSSPPQTYWQLNGKSVAANSTLSVNVTTGGVDMGLVQNLVVLGGGGLAAILLLTLPFIQRRRAQAQGATAETDERLARLQEIADLDDAFEAGEIGEEEYRNERATLKAELMQLS
ncbi:MAG: hypothetical protein WCF84_11965 [Anaerolineae bacterium]